MKVSLYLNDYFVKYNAAQKSKDEVSNLKIGYVEGVYNPDDLFILRGEPTYRDDLHKIFKIFKNKNYILTTQGFDVDKLISYEDTIPYISFHWDGFFNDTIKASPGLTYNMIRCLEALKHKKTIFRISYTINPFNSDSLDADIAIMRKLLSSYPNMKQPYFMLYQSGTYYSQDKQTWTYFAPHQAAKLNAAGLLTQKNLQYLTRWLKREPYFCTSIKDEAVVMPDATLRVCQSFQLSNALGWLNDKNLKQIMESSEDTFNNLRKCPFREQCWLAYNYKENKRSE